MSKTGVISHWFLLGGSAKVKGKRSGRELVVGWLYQGYCHIRDYSCTRLEAFDRKLNKSQKILCYGLILLFLLIMAVWPLVRWVVSSPVSIPPRAASFPPPLPNRATLAPDTLIHAFTLKPIIYENEQK